MGYNYPHRDDETAAYIATGSAILGLPVTIFGSWILGLGILIGGALIGVAIDNYQKTEGAEYIATHYSGEDAIREAMELAKGSRNDAFWMWVAGGFFFWLTYLFHSPAGMAIVGLGNLANFIMIFIAHRRYSELRKMLMILQLKKSDKAEISIKL